jgi:hypothetical protein
MLKGIKSPLQFEKLLGKFSGEPGTVVFEIWHERFEQVLRGTRANGGGNVGPSALAKLRTLIGLLEGPALQHYFQLAQLDRGRTYPDLVEALREQYGSAVSPRTSYRQQFAVAKQRENEQVRDYASRLRFLYGKAFPDDDGSERAEEELIQQFQTGVHSYLSQLVLGQGMSCTYSELVKKAAYFESYYRNHNLGKPKVEKKKVENSPVCYATQAEPSDNIQRFSQFLINRLTPEAGPVAEPEEKSPALYEPDTIQAYPSENRRGGGQAGRGGASANPEGGYTQPEQTTAFRGGGRGRGRGGGRGRGRGGGNGFGDRKLICFRCQKEGHMARDCLAPRPVPRPDPPVDATVAAVACADSGTAGQAKGKTPANEPEQESEFDEGMGESANQQVGPSPEVRTFMVRSDVPMAAQAGKVPGVRKDRSKTPAGKRIPLPVHDVDPWTPDAPVQPIAEPQAPLQPTTEEMRGQVSTLTQEMEHMSQIMLQLQERLEVVQKKEAVPISGKAGATGIYPKVVDPLEELRAASMNPKPINYSYPGTHVLYPETDQENETAVREVTICSTAKPDTLPYWFTEGTQGSQPHPESNPLIPLDKEIEDTEHGLWEEAFPCRFVNMDAHGSFVREAEAEVDPPLREIVPQTKDVAIAYSCVEKAKTSFHGKQQKSTPHFSSTSLNETVPHVTDECEGYYAGRVERIWMIQSEKFPWLTMKDVYDRLHAVDCKAEPPVCLKREQNSVLQGKRFKLSLRWKDCFPFSIFGPAPNLFANGIFGRPRPNPIK